MLAIYATAAPSNHQCLKYVTLNVCLPEIALKLNYIVQVHSDFVAAATRGAMAVIDGNVMAINPGEDAK